MKANEFLHKKDVAYMNRLSTSLDFDRIVSLMEEYAALRIHDVVGQSEQLVCDSCGCRPNVIYTTSKGRFCERCKPAN
jgi:hypothetical protein